ncbi:MAG: shikimate kinase AroK [Gammaproteobacteria bacterium]|nr:shikimate kinase AroK [Gammaproteobacteria bacterium]
MITSNIFLIGPMGAGKSTVGKQLAKALGRDFYDTDKEIERRTGVSISWIFEMEGESGFRQREQKVLDELSQLKNIVLATGGGIVLPEENRRMLRSRGYVVYLSTSIEQLLRRTNKDKNRPLLQTDNPRETVKALMAERTPLYQGVADIELRTGEQSIQYVVSGLVNQLEQIDQ